MEESQAMQVKASQQGCNPVLTLGGRVSQGTTLTVLAVAGAGAGLILGWDSLVATGLSGLVLAVLPCAAMCALGLCASRIGHPKEAQPPTAETVANAEASAVEKNRAPAP